MYAVTKHISFCYGHRLLEYSGKCRHLHGHNGILEIEIEKAKLDKLGFVMDLSDISALVKKWVDDELDHKMLLNQNDPVIAMMKEHQQPYVAVAGNPTAEAIAKLVFDWCRAHDLPVASVRLWETPTSNACYRD
ncbi:MAG: 6-carboxytetrahydropterin synthase [Elusimicrobia bacterium]|nr:6-carboxytetrahydropterin synthase [Elusimicrobiota bacterium]